MRFAARRTVHHGAGGRLGIAPLCAPLRTHARWPASRGGGGGRRASRRAERDRRAARARRARASAASRCWRGETAARRACKRIALGQLDLAIELLRGEAARAAAEQGGARDAQGAQAPARAGAAAARASSASSVRARERGPARRRPAPGGGTRRGGDGEHARGAAAPPTGKLARRRGVIELRERLRARAPHRNGADAPGRRHARSRSRRSCAPCARAWRSGSCRTAPRTGCVRPGLRHIYRAGRPAARRAGAAQGQPQRRCTSGANASRTYATPLEILDVQDPSTATAKSSGKRRDTQSSKRIRQARPTRRTTLGELLGEEHDLTVLAELAGSHKSLRATPARTQAAAASDRPQARPPAQAGSARGQAPVPSASPSNSSAACMRSHPRELQEVPQIADVKPKKPPPSDARPNDPNDTVPGLSTGRCGRARAAHDRRPRRAAHKRVVRQRRLQRTDARRDGRRVRSRDHRQGPARGMAGDGRGAAVLEPWRTVFHAVPRRPRQRGRQGLSRRCGVPGDVSVHVRRADAARRHAHARAAGQPVARRADRGSGRRRPGERADTAPDPRRRPQRHRLGRGFAGATRSATSCC